MHDDLNLKVSELRGYRMYPSHVCGMSGFGLGIDDICAGCREPTRYDAVARENKFREKEHRVWTNDTNWPILLRELPMPEIDRRNDGSWGVSYCVNDPNKDFYEWPLAGDDSELGIAVCLAWIDWKQKAGI